jgi:hypothetical protein
MQALALFLVMVAAIVLLPFSMASDSPFRQREQVASEASAYQLETFARAAWHLARRGVTGALDRGAMVLPSGFTDDPTRPYQTYVEGSYLYVWETGGKPEDQRQELIFPTADVTVDVGMSTASSILFRDGATAPRPTWLPYPNLVVRLRI